MPALVLGRSSYLTTWGSIYPSSVSDTNASCALCHASANDTSNWNGYGQAIRNATGATLTARIQAVQAANSDGDPGGASNLDEINAGSQPGWTAGNNNTIYDVDGLATPNQPPPAGITGPLDPVPPTPTIAPTPTPTIAPTPTPTAGSGDEGSGHGHHNHHRGGSERGEGDDRAPTGAHGARPE